MNTKLLITLLAGALLASAAPANARADIDVVATVPDLAALAKEIGGNHVSVTALSLPTQDPHWVDAKPSLALKVNKADLLLAIGVDLEVGWLPTLQKGARNTKVQRSGNGFLECAPHVDLLEVPKGPIDRSMGDIHAGGNPHYLYDPRAGKSCAQAIANKLSAIDPGNSGTYRDNLKKFERQLDAATERWEAKMKAYRGMPVVTYHRSLVYLNNWLGLDEIANLEPKPGIAPSPGHVAKVIRMARSKKVKVLFQEAYYPSRTGNLVAAKIGAKLVSLDGGTNFNAGQSYIGHLDQVISQLANALGS